MVAGLLAVGLALPTGHDGPPPVPPAAMAGAAAAPTASAPTASATHRTAHPTPTPAALPRSTPVRLSVPALGVDSSLITVGNTSSGEVAVPAGADVDRAAWFTGSPTPGQVGPAVVVGHVDNDHAPSVFYRLGALRVGDVAVVRRADGRDAAFTVYRAERVAKDAFPTTQVYGNTPGPELRLITCGGSFDDASGHYRDNIVVFARLTSAGSTTEHTSPTGGSPAS